eukprot:gene360-681_t
MSYQQPDSGQFYQNQNNEFQQGEGCVPPSEDRYGLVLNNMNLKNGATGELMFDTNFIHDETRHAFWGQN